MRACAPCRDARTPPPARYPRGTDHNPHNDGLGEDLIDPYAARFCSFGSGLIASSAGTSAMPSTRMPYTKTIVPPSHPPSVRQVKPIKVSASGPPPSEPAV